MPATNLPYSSLSDLQLFQLVKQDKTYAFEELYQRHWTGMMNTAYRRLQSRQKSEDIVQDIFISLYQKRYTLELTTSLKAYLNQAIKFKILNIFRDEFIRTSFRREAFFMQVCKNDSANLIEEKDLKEKVGKILGSLPEKCRQVYMMSRDQNLSNKDISASLRISVSTVEKHIVKALKIMRSNLKAQEYMV